MTKQEKFKELTKDYIDKLKENNIIGIKTGKFILSFCLSGGGIGNIEFEKETKDENTIYSTLTHKIKVKEKLFWEGTD